MGDFVVIADADLASAVLSERRRSDAARYEEVWNGVYVMSPSPDFDHQRLTTRLAAAIDSVLEAAGAGVTLCGFDVSDRAEGWTQNYRVPDVVVTRVGNPGTNDQSHFQGGPDFLVEVLGPNDLAREKIPFYAGLGVRELLLVDRDPWALALYRLRDDALTGVGRSTVDDPGPVRSEVLPLAFRLIPGEPRPLVEVRRDDGNAVWTA